MELSHDWKTFHDFFGIRERVNPLKEQPSPGSIFLLTENRSGTQRVVFIHAEHEDLSSWIGSSLGDVQSRFEHRTIHVFEKDSVESWMESSAAKSEHFFDYLKRLRDRAIPAAKGPKLGRPADHFLLETLQGKWGKFLPSSFGLCLELAESSQKKRVLLIFRRGILESFLTPDVSSLPTGRGEELRSLSKYLAEKYHLPVHCLRVSPAVWRDLSSGQRPWKALQRAIRSRNAEVYPRNSGLSMLTTTLPWLGR